jgi:hypothetical protein
MQKHDARLPSMFDAVEDVVDVDSYMAEPYEYWRFDVDTEKAVRRGISVDTINGSLAMAMGSYKLGDIKRGSVLEPTYIAMQIPLAVRSQVTRLGDLPIPTVDGKTIPLSELGEFKKGYEDPIIYTIDLRGIEYVTAEMQGRLGAPIYGMLNIEDMVKEYTTPDGVTMETMPWNLFGPPADDTVSAYEWTGEWTVTYETFRDMGGAFMAALILIYGLIVREFKNFALAGLIMSPIPVTMMGIIPGHWIMGAEFTATSMIGMIALGGIIVRQSILIVEFVKLEVAKGNEVKEAAIKGAELRMRPIFITSLTLMAGAFAILQDPIFNGMAISLLFGAGIATVMALLIIPLGCISARRQFYVETTDDGRVKISNAFEQVENISPGESSAKSGPSLMGRLWGGFIGMFAWVFYIIKAVFTMIFMGVRKIFGGGGGGGTPPPPRAGGGTPPPPRPGGGTPPPPREAPPSKAGGTPPPPREAAPGEAKGAPPREVPPGKVKGTPPPPRETPPSKVKGTPPPPRETPPSEAKAEPAPPQEAPVEKAAETSSSAPAEAPAASEPKAAPAVNKTGSEEDANGTVGEKRRGIRLKQDLD